MISGLLLTPNPLGSRSLPTMNANSSAFPASRSRIGSTAILDILKSVTDSTQSGDNKGTIRSDIQYLVVSKKIRRHRLISISYISHGRCHGRGREFESRRPRHSFQNTYADFGETICTWPILRLNYLAGTASRGRTSRSTLSAISSSATSRS